MINLLPPQLSANKGIAKIGKTVRSLTLVSVVIFILFALGIIGFFVVNNIELTRLNSQRSTLEGNIKELEGTEQKLVLLKDRIGKIKTARNSQSAKEEINGVVETLTFLSGDVSVTDLLIDSQKSDMSITFRNSSDLGLFLTNLLNRSPFGSVILTSFGFNPTSGYLVSLRMTDIKTK